MIVDRPRGVTVLGLKLVVCLPQRQRVPWEPGRLRPRAETPVKTKLDTHLVMVDGTVVKSLGWIFGDVRKNELRVAKVGDSNSVLGIAMHSFFLGVY